MSAGATKNSTWCKITELKFILIINRHFFLTGNKTQKISFRVVTTMRKRNIFIINITKHFWKEGCCPNIHYLHYIIVESLLGYSQPNYSSKLVLEPWENVCLYTGLWPLKLSLSFWIFGIAFFIVITSNNVTIFREPQCVKAAKSRHRIKWIEKVSLLYFYMVSYFKCNQKTLLA